MILVRGIGMSGYVPLDGVVGLFHLRSDCVVCGYRFGYGCKHKCRPNFDYLRGVESERITRLDVLSKVVSFAVFRRFSDSVLFSIIRDIGLLSGYHCAGPLFPRDLFCLLETEVGLRYYRDLAYIPYVPSNRYGQFLCSTVWAEYICVDNDFSWVYWPRFDVQILGLRKTLPVFIRDGFQIFDVRDMLITSKDP